MTGTTLALNNGPAPVMSDQEIDRTYRIAKALAMSGFFKDARQAEQAFAKMLFGRDLGLTPTQAMTSINIVEGKPELSANLQASLVRSAPGYDYKVTELTDSACRIEYFRDGELLGESTFSMADAERAGLAGKGVWQKYPRNMLFARAMSNGVAFHCPEVTGGLRVYSEGEISGDEQAPLEPPVDTIEYGHAPDASGAPGVDPVSDVPSDFPLPEEPPEDPETGPEEISGEVVRETIDPAFTNDLFDVMAAKLATVGQFRSMLEGVGADLPQDLRSREARLGVVAGLSVQQAVQLEKALRVIPEQRAAA